MPTRHFAVPFAFLCTVSALFGSEAVKIAKATAEAAVTSKALPVYPVIAKQMRIEGDVELRAVVNDSGTVQNIEVVAGNPILARAAVEALNKWRFNSGKIEGSPTRWTADFTMHFKLP